MPETAKIASFGPNPAEPILLVDDEISWLRSLAVTLRRSADLNHLVQCSDSRRVLDTLAGGRFSLVVLDLTMPHLTGKDLLPQIVSEHPDVPIIILSGLNQLETAVECIKLGAFDYFVKTTEQDRLVAGIHRALAYRAKDQELRRVSSRLFKRELEQPEVFNEIVSVSPKMHVICQYLEAIAASSEPVLITGESGVGKELVARALQKLSRSGKPFVPLNAAGLDDNVFADTLFGHVKGAFTDASRPRAGLLEKAADGVLFLDEIGDLSLPSQVKLLRLLQEREYYPVGGDIPRRARARLVFATNLDLAVRQGEGLFRKDLFYRLNAHQVDVPPLRERREDIPALMEHFLAAAAAEQGKKKPTPPPELAVLLSTYNFPGNIRELRGMVHNAVSLHQGKKLSMTSFKQAIDQANSSPETSPAVVAETPHEQLFAAVDQLPTLTDAAELLVAEALRRAGNNQAIAARLLGISRQALNKRLKKTPS